MNAFLPSRPVGTVYNQGIRALQLIPEPPGNVIRIRKNVGRLWEPFTSHVFEEASLGHCALIAREYRGQAQLFFEDASKRRHGAIADPLKIAVAMLTRGTERIEFRKSATATSIEMALLAVLAGGFQKVTIAADELYRLDDYWIAQADAYGLPLLPGLAYTPRSHPNGVTTIQPFIEDFRHFVRQTDSTEAILESLRRGILPRHAHQELLPILFILMKKAFWLLEVRSDVHGAISLWRTVYSLEDSEHNRKAVILTMMKAANLLNRTKVEAAIEIWKAVYQLDSSADNRTAVIRTMMDVANKINPTRMDAAIAIWRAVYPLEADGTLKQRVFRTMMDVANKSVRSRREKEVDAVLRLWVAVYQLHPDEGSRHRLIRTVMDVARKRPLVCERGIRLLTMEDGCVVDSYFRERILGGLYYHTRRFKDVIRLVENSRHNDPSILTLQADAYRKQGLYEEAIRLTSSIIRNSPQSGLSLMELDGLIVAYCCRGYCRLVEAKKGDPRSIPEALDDFRRAISLSERHDLPAPPRAYMGLAYAHQWTGDIAEALAACTKCLETDPDNSKAYEFMRRF